MKQYISHTCPLTNFQIGDQSYLTDVLGPVQTPPTPPTIHDDSYHEAMHASMVESLHDLYGCEECKSERAENPFPDDIDAQEQSLSLLHVARLFSLGAMKEQLCPSLKKQNVRILKILVPLAFTLNVLDTVPRFAFRHHLDSGALAFREHDEDIADIIVSAHGNIGCNVCGAVGWCVVDFAFEKSRSSNAPQWLLYAARGTVLRGITIEESTENDAPPYSWSVN